MQDTIRLGLVYGSAREGRLCDTVADWVRGELWAKSGMEVVPIDPLALRGADGAIDRRRTAERVGAADAFVVVTPEYNHGYTGALKDLIDAAYDPWHAKPVAFVSYGGISGGLRAVEQLRLVFAELHAVAIRDSVSFANVWQQVGPDGDLDASDKARSEFARMIERLGWWARALKTAREENDYLALSA